MDWQVGFSYYSQTRPCSKDNSCKSGIETPRYSIDDLAMFPLEWPNGRAHNASKDHYRKFEEDYVLSKGEYTEEQAKRLFNTTLTAFHPEASGPDETTPSSMGLNTNPKLFQAVSDPLSGLDALLSKKPRGSVRPGSHVVVLLFGDIPYYPRLEWRNFFNKHKNVSLIAVSSRYANVSNFVHLLQKDKYDFKFLPACDDSDSPARIVRAIKNKVQ